MSTILKGHVRWSLVVGALVVAGCGPGDQDLNEALSTSVAALSDGASPMIVVIQGPAGLPGQAHANVSARVHDLEGNHGFRADHVYEHALSGFAARLTPPQIAALQGESHVAFIEADQPMQAIATQTIPAGIAAVGATTSSTLAGNGSGAVVGVNLYIIDTGIDTQHPDLNVVEHVNFAGGKNADCYGHGTHVSGTAAAIDNTSYVVGVAPGARLHGVKVLGCNGSGFTSGVIAGVDWVTAHAVLPAVANMSLGGGASTALDNAVINSVHAGIVYAVAAGNDGADACNSSPARAGLEPGVITVGAVDSAGNTPYWSNFGPCVDIVAPGVNVLSTKLRGGTTTMSGTSMATPHVAGGAALYLSSHAGDAPDAVEASLKGTATAVAGGMRLNVAGY